MRVNSYFETIKRLLFAFFLLALPVTSFPFLPAALGGAALVRPLSFYPMSLLLLFGVLPILFRERLPKELFPLIAFVLSAGISTLLGIVSGMEIVPEAALFSRGLRTFVSLFLGIGVYLTITLLPHTKEDLERAIRWMIGGFAAALAWGSLQIVYVLHFSKSYFLLISKIQKYFSIRKLFHKRISGLTFEPNWFADQLVFLLMPWLIASVLTSHTVFRWRWKRLTVETILLLWASVVLVFTYSRIGLFLLIIQVIIAVLVYPNREKKTGNTGDRKKRWLKRVLVLMVIVLVLMAIVFLFGQKNNYFSRLWSYWSIKDKTTLDYFEYIAFSQRFVYWKAAYRMFERNPLFGVGLGYFTYQFPAYFQDRPLYQIPELLRKFVPEAGHNPTVTVKNFMLRVLAETGLAGAAFFSVFVLMLAGNMLLMLKAQDGFQVYWGVAGLFGLITFVLMTTSYDSFAIPNMWVVFGFINAGFRVCRSGSARQPARQLPDNMET